MPPQRSAPIGLLLGQTSKAVTRAFGDALAAEGGSEPTWLVLLSLVRGLHRTQADLARAVGVTGPTMTHHLAAMERAGLVARERAEGDRRAQLVTITDAGRAAFHRMRAAAVAHDTRLRAGLSDDDVDRLRDLLTRLAANVGAVVPVASHPGTHPGTPVCDPACGPGRSTPG